MKLLIKNINQYLILFYFVIWTACCCGLILPLPAFGEKSVADEIISLNVTDQPLSEVLEQISTAARCRFSVDESWADYPITATFENEPLYRGLKLIFRNINNAVIYGSDRTIRIIFYDNGTPSSTSAGSSFTIESPQEPVQMSQPFSEATAPQPEVESPEESRSAENLEEMSEEDSESESETDKTDAENMEAEKQEAGEAEEEINTADSETEEKEEAPERESNQTDDSDSAN